MRKFFRTDPCSKFIFTFEVGVLEPWVAPRAGEKPTPLVIAWQRGAHVSSASLFNFLTSFEHATTTTRGSTQRRDFENKK